MIKKTTRLGGLGTESNEINKLLSVINEGDYTKAVNLAKTFVQKFPQLSFGWMALGTVLKLLGHNEDAEEALGKALVLAPKDVALLNDLGSIQLDLCRFNSAEANFRIALQIKPDFAEAHTNLGVALQSMGSSDEAELCHQRALQLKPDFTEAYFNLGISLHAQGKLDEAELSYKKALLINPNYVTALNNLGITLQEMYKLEESEIVFCNAVIIKSDFAEAHFNLGNTYLSLGRLDDAVAAYQRALQIRKKFSRASNNLGCVFEEQERYGEAEDFYRQAVLTDPDYVEAKHNLANALRHLGKPNEAEESYRRMLNFKFSKISSVTSQRVTALLPIGRSGSLFFHSLFDEHPEILTLPGVYFKGWFGDGLWNKQFNPDTKNPNWRIHLVSKIVDKYEPLFDAQSKKNVPGNPMDSNWLAKDMGFMEMGADRLQHLAVNKEAFVTAFLSLLAPLPTITQAECFTLIHKAFEIAVREINVCSTQENKVIFYHIHNPNLYELTRFLQNFPRAQLLYIVRNPVQSMESWMLTASEGRRINSPQVEGNDNAKKMKVFQDISLRKWNQMVHLIDGMFKYMQLPLTQIIDSRGIRLEDVKRNPHRVLPQIADWIGVSDNPALYDSSFCGLQYWGPSSNTTGKITGFDTSAIDRVKGQLLSQRDIRIFETLFWPFAKLYGYTDLDVAGFRRQLYEIRPWLDEPLEFETRLYAELPDHSKSIQELHPHNRLHRLLHNYWRILDRDGTYHAMVPPFKLH